jgi:hypothetical protein
MHSFTQKDGIGFFSNKKSKDNFFQPKLSIDKESVQRVSEDSATKSSEEDCKGWESDSESFCTKVAKHFMLTEFGSSAQISSIEVFNDEDCRAYFEDGVVITMLKMGDQKVFVHVSPFSTKKIKSRVRCYNYTCSISGALILTVTSCR